MEAIIFIGIQASGKSTFFREHFFDTHIRLSLDMLRTRHRETILLNACIQGKQPFVIDNTNPTVEERARYIHPAKLAGYKIVEYYFETEIESAIRRNESRKGKKRIPIVGIRSTRNKLQLPSAEEGYDELYFVRITENGFVVDLFRALLNDEI